MENLNTSKMLNQLKAHKYKDSSRSRKLVVVVKYCSSFHDLPTTHILEAWVHSSLCEWSTPADRDAAGLLHHPASPVTSGTEAATYL